MGTYATSTDVASVRSALAGYATSITHSNSDTQTFLQAQANLALDLWADCTLAIVNVNASAAQSYSSSVGNQVNRRMMDELREQADKHMSDFVRYCGLGGVTVPTFDDAVSYWDMSGVSHE